MVKSSQVAQFYQRLVCYFFVIFGLMIALPVVVWDITSRMFFSPISIALTFFSAFLPIGVIAWLNIEHDPEDAEVPFRFGEEAVVRASKTTGILIGAMAIFWLAI